MELRGNSQAIVSQNCRNIKQYLALNYIHFVVISLQIWSRNQVNDNSNAEFYLKLKQSISIRMIIVGMTVISKEDI